MLKTHINRLTSGPGDAYGAPEPSVRFAMSPMPNFMPKVPLAHARPMLPAMLCVVAAHPRFGLPGCAKRVGSGIKVLTRRCSGSASPPTELQR